MKITLEVSEENESTDSPYWLLFDPRPNMSLDVHAMASMITGPFFSRADAEEYLKRRRYAYSKRAVVYACSGYWSDQYKDQWRVGAAAARLPGHWRSIKGENHGLNSQPGDTWVGRAPEAA